MEGKSEQALLPSPPSTEAETQDLEKGIITKGVFSLEESLESLKSREIGRTLLHFPESGGSLKSLESLNSLDSVENGLFCKPRNSSRQGESKCLPLVFWDPENALSWFS